MYVIIYGDMISVRRKVIYEGSKVTTDLILCLHFLNKVDGKYY